MARPLRIELAGAVYHITSRGDRQERIFHSDADRVLFLDILGQAFDRFQVQAYAYCLMGNHYHLVIRTGLGNLSAVMRHINGVYTQAFNARHHLTGHLFQGRYHSLLVDRDAWLLEVCRYVALNPVRANLVRGPGHWQWSSYRAIAGTTHAPAWLDRASVLGAVAGRTPESDDEEARAVLAWQKFVADGVDKRFRDLGVRQQIYLGSSQFVAAIQERLRAQANIALVTREVPRQQRARMQTCAEWLALGHDRDVAVLKAYREGGQSMTAIARASGLSVSRVSRLISRHERDSGGSVHGKT